MGREGSLAANSHSTLQVPSLLWGAIFSAVKQISPGNPGQVSLSLPCSQDDLVWPASAEYVPGALQPVKPLPPLLILFEAGSHCVGQTDFKLTEICLLSAGIERYARPNSTQLSILLNWDWHQEG